MRLSKWLSDYFYTFPFLVFCGNSYSVISEITYVLREEGTDKYDKFGPVKRAGDNCTPFKAFRGSTDDQCQCQSDTHTFLYFENSCVSKPFIENTLIRKSADCNGNVIYFSEPHKPYIVLDLGKPSHKKFVAKIKNINGQNCSVSRIHYIDGRNNGTLTQYRSLNVFAINKATKELSWQQVTTDSSLHGRIIILQTQNCEFKITGNNGRTKTNPCITFKAKGRVNFLSTPTTVKPSASTTKTDATSLYSTSTSLPSVNPTKTQPVTSTHVSTLVKTSMATTPQPSSIPHVVVFTTTPTFIPVTSSAIPTKPSNPADNKRQNNEQSGAPVGAIVGTVAGILVIVIAIIVIFFWRRRKRENTRKSSKAGNGQNHKDNPTYGKNETIDLSKQKQVPKITGNELEYDYAAVDGDPRASNGAAPGIYQSLIKDPNRESVYTPLERQEANEYNKVERAPFKPARNGPTDPTYNVLERPIDNNDDYLGQGPGSHVDKNKRPHSNLAPQNNEPVYNVLEGPNQEGEDEPEYNVLEDPDGQDDPEYNVLEDPDDNYDNAPVETDRGHPSSHDNVGYASTIDFKKRQGTKNEPVYEAPEGPSSELTYQPLQINSRDNVYQPLDRTSRMIPDDQPVYHVLESQGSEA